LIRAAILLLLLPATGSAGMVPTPVPAEDELASGLRSVLPGQAARIARALGIEDVHAAGTLETISLISLALTGLGVVLLLIAIIGYGIFGDSPKKGRLEDLP